MGNVGVNWSSSFEVGDAALVWSGGTGAVLWFEKRREGEKGREC